MVRDRNDTLVSKNLNSQEDEIMQKINRRKTLVINKSARKINSSLMSSNNSRKMTETSSFQVNLSCIKKLLFLKNYNYFVFYRWRLDPITIVKYLWKLITFFISIYINFLIKFYFRLFSNLYVNEYFLLTNYFFEKNIQFESFFIL